MTKDESIVRPKPIAGFERERAAYIPVDSPKHIIKNAVKEATQVSRQILEAEIYLLENQVVIMGAIGAPQAALVLERLVAGGTKEILLLGLCGSLHPRSRLLDVLCVSEAFPDEGTSPHYAPEQKVFHPSPTLHNHIESTLQSAGLPYLNGAVVSTDAPYRETTAWLEKNLDRGVDGVDMETSAVLALAGHHGIQAAALLVVSDELRRDGHVSGFMHPELEDRLRDYFLPFLLS